jgi:8-oxo-dGTP diphosphatase
MSATRDQVQRIHPELLVAAGGLLWRRTLRGRRLAVIHRSRYGDWTLPKGKLQPGESTRDAAVREVREETGCEARISSFAGTVCYEVSGRPKLVLFWQMEAGSCGDFSPDEEVARVVWLAPARALRRLDHEGERDLVTRAIGRRKPDQTAKRRTLIPNPFRRRKKRFRSRSYRRLDGTLRAYAQELEWRLNRNAGAPPAWSPVAFSLLRESRRCLRRGLIDEGWQTLMAAQRLELLALDEDERATRAAALREEAKRKLTAWRRAAVLDAVPVGSAPTPTALWFATLIRDENAQNEYRKLAVFRDQLTTMGVLVGLILFAIAVLARWHPIPFAEYEAYAGSFALLVYVLLFGMLGGAISTMIPRGPKRPSGRIPEHLTDAAFGRLRPLIGAASALVIYIAFVADILPFALTADVGAAVLLLAFAAGFSERLVVRAIEAMVGRYEESPDAFARDRTLAPEPVADTPAPGPVTTPVSDPSNPSMTTTPGTDDVAHGDDHTSTRKEKP